uniref:PKD domain-containing protein n=1 Tax=Tetradesmus obliquus TaxID=3088 RepID=A0A383WLE3_TETOB
MCRKACFLPCSPPPAPPPPPMPPTVPLCYYTTNGQLPYPAVAPQNLPQYSMQQYGQTAGSQSNFGHRKLSGATDADSAAAAGTVPAEDADSALSSAAGTRSLKQSAAWSTDPSFTSYVSQDVVRSALNNGQASSYGSNLQGYSSGYSGSYPSTASTPGYSAATGTAGAATASSGLGSGLFGSIGSALRSGTAGTKATGSSNPLQGLGGLLTKLGTAMQGSSANSIAQAAGSTAGQYSQGYAGGTTAGSTYLQYSTGSTTASTAAGGSTNPYASLQYSNGQLATGLGSASGGYSGTSNMLQQGVSSAQGLANSVAQQQQVTGAYQVPSSSSSSGTGQFVSQNPNPSGAFDPTTGKMVGAPAGQGAVPGGYYWSGGYWGYCLPPSPPAPMLMQPPPPPPGATQGLIKSPQPLSFWSVGPTGLAPVLLDATGSSAAPSRRIVAYGWVVKSASDGTPQATATGVSTTILLPRGMYVVTLNVVDSTGSSSAAGPLQFTVAGQGSSSSGGSQGSGSSIDPSLAVMLAKIASPPPIVMMAAGGGNVSIQLDAAGSSASPGFVIDQYAWTVTNQQAGNSIVLSQQVVRQVSAAFVALPVGSYIVSLVVRDTSGRNASIAQNFVVAGGSPTNTIAVISQPLSYTAASPGSLTTILLDAQNSSPKPGTTITQYVWAVISMPDRQPVAITTGKVAQVRLPPGSYQLGLLVLDSSAGNAIAQKNFILAGPQGSGSSQSPDGSSDYEDQGADGSSQPPQQPNEAPDIIDLVQPLQGECGGRVSLPAISDPNGDAVSVSWQLQQGRSSLRSGTGSVISLVGVPAGMYSILVTAGDGRLTATGTYQLKVNKPAGSGSSSSKSPAPGSSLPKPTLPPTGGSSSSSDVLPPQVIVQLPSLTLAQGAVLEVDAAAAGVPIKDLALYSYKWTLSNKASGQTIATQSGQHVRLPLATADSLQLELAVARKTGGGPAAIGQANLKVLPRAAGSAVLPAVYGSCGPFRSTPTANVSLACPGLAAKVGGSSGKLFTGKLVWAWRVTRVEDSRITTKVGSPANLGQQAVGKYLVEAAVGVGGPPTSSNTVYFLYSYMQVAVAAAAAPAGGSSSGSSGGGSAAMRQAAPAVTSQSIWQQWDAQAAG